VAYQPFPTQVQAHRAFLLDGYKRGVLFWSRRTGKTQWSLQQLVYSCLLNQGPHHIVFKEYQQAETVAWNQYLHTIPEGLVAKTDKSTLTITFHHFGTDANGEPSKMILPGIGEVTIEHDEKKPASSIRLLGSDKADAHRGGESWGMIFDEYQDQDPSAWDAVYSKFFATTNGWAAFMGTAKDIDHWNELLDRAEHNEDWYYSKATWRENPLITPEWVLQDRKEAEAKGALGVWLQEMELIPFNIQGVVYPMFNKKVHVVQPEEVPEQGTDYIALDYGFAEGHPVAACFVRITHDDVWYVYDEIHGTGIQIDDLISTIRAKMGDRRITAIVADSARPDLIDYMQSKGLPSSLPQRSSNPSWLVFNWSHRLSNLVRRLSETLSPICYSLLPALRLSTISRTTSTRKSRKTVLHQNYQRRRTMTLVMPSVTSTCSSSSGNRRATRLSRRD